MQIIDLNGIWKLRWFDGARNGQPEFADRDTIDQTRYLDAQVPGEVHLDLVRAGILTDPRYGVNVLSARWVEECMWAYRTEFDVPTEAVSGHAWLYFECLDYTARIVLNGAEIGRHANSFLPCRLAVTGKLKAGRNVLAVHLESGLFEVADKPIAPYETTRSDLLTKRQWLRKSTQQAGNMDWSNRLLNIGIQGEVKMEWTPAPIRLDRLVPLAEVSPDLSTGTVIVRQFIEGLNGEDKATKARLTAKLEESGASGSADIDVVSGLHPYELTLRIEKPELWWPREHGLQRLYTLRVTVEIEGLLIGESRAKIGFRRIQFNQSPHPNQGLYFMLEVNNRPVFAKGANMIPADMIQADIDRSRYEKLIALAAEANFNFLRVWGGGFYESDAFYEACDEHGIMVWQDFSYAALAVPAHDPVWHDNVMAESIYQVRRLTRHPSLIAWCGNNEMEIWSYTGFYSAKDRPRLVDHGLFHLALPRMLKQEDPTRYYQPSSPYSPDLVSPMDDHSGDQHPWNIGMRNTDFRDYRNMTCRFADEGGALGPRSYPTMTDALPIGQQYAHSFAWEVHDNAIAGMEEPSCSDGMLAQWLGLRIEDMSLEDYAYWGGLLQGEGLSGYICNFRRRMFDSAAAVFWMFNDCWPTNRSWSIVDYGLRRVPAFWHVKRAFRPVTVVVVVEGDEVVVFGVNDTSHSVEGALTYGQFTLTGDYPMRHEISVTLPPNASTRLAVFPLQEWRDHETTAAFALLTNASGILARHRLLLPFYKEMPWPDANISVTVQENRATFVSDTFAWNVCLDLNGERDLADNFFDLYPGMAHSIEWPWKAFPRILHIGNRLRINTLVDDER